MAHISRLCFVLITFCLLQSGLCEDRQISETERLRNTPPELSSTGGRSVSPGQAEARFIPFSASFSLSAGGNNAQSFSIAGTPDGIGLSQSSSHGSAGTNGNPGSFSASQSSSIAAGLNGISTADANSFAGNHPLYGPTAQSNGNSFAVGQAAASAHGDVVNGQAVSGAQSSVGGTHSQASSSANAAASGATNQNLIQLRPDRPQWGNAPPHYGSGNNGDYYYNSQHKPSLTITVSDDRNRFGIRPSNGWYEVPETPPREPWRRPDYCDQYNGWYRDPRCRSPKVVVTKPVYRPNRPVHFENTRDPRHEGGRVQISTASAASSAQSGPSGLAIGQSSAQSSGNRQPSLTINRVEASGNAQAHAQGATGSVHHHSLNGRPGRGPGSLQANLSSGSVSASSRPGGFAQGSSSSSSQGANSNSQVNVSSGEGGSAHGSANAGSVVTFPGPSSAAQIIPKEFIRSKRPKDGDEFDEIITDLTDTVYEIFDV